MPSSSVSFRITRNAEDLAETIHALSQRLVALEGRMEALEEDLAGREDGGDPEEIESLANVERLLRDCRDLLGEEPSSRERSDGHLERPDSDDVVVAA